MVQPAPIYGPTVWSVMHHIDIDVFLLSLMQRIESLKHSQVGFKTEPKNEYNKGYEQACIDAYDFLNRTRGEWNRE